MGILIEHYAGEFPLWLAPLQALVLPVVRPPHRLRRRRWSSGSPRPGCARASTTAASRSGARSATPSWPRCRTCSWSATARPSRARRRCAATSEGDLGTLALDDDRRAPAARRPPSAVQRREHRRADGRRRAGALVRADADAPRPARAARGIGRERGARRAGRRGDGGARAAARRAAGGRRGRGAGRARRRRRAVGARRAAREPAPGRLARGPGRARERDLRAARLGRARARGRPARPPAHARRGRRRGRRRARRLAAAGEALAPAPAAADRVPARSAGSRRRPASRADFEGSRFTGTAAPADEIGPGAQDPIRVFVGVHAAPSVEERARLAVDELERLGAFSRRRILVCSRDAARLRQPDPGRGRGAPLGRRRRLRRRPVPRQAHAADAARRCGSRRARTARCSRSCGGGCRPAARGLRLRREPRRVGEPERVPRAAGCARSTRSRVARALWIGTPYFSRLPRLLAKGAIPSDARVGTIRTKQLLGGRGRASDWRFVFLERRTDPVVLFSGLDLIWRRPDWLPPGRWTPGVTFVQLAFDLVSATNWTATVPAGAGARLPARGPAGRRPRVRPPRRPRARGRARRPARRRGGRARRTIACAEAWRRLYSEPLTTRSQTVRRPA